MTPQWTILAATVRAGWWLLADRAQWQRMGDRFDSSRIRFGVWELATIVAVLAVIAGGFALLAFAARVQRRSAERGSNATLWDELCGVHRLDRDDQQLVKNAARLGGLASPAEVFVRPEVWDDPRLAGLAEAPEAAALRDLLYGAGPSA